MGAWRVWVKKGGGLRGGGPWDDGPAVCRGPGRTWRMPGAARGVVRGTARPKPGCGGPVGALDPRGSARGFPGPWGRGVATGDTRTQCYASGRSGPMAAPLPTCPPGTFAPCSPHHKPTTCPLPPTWRLPQPLPVAVRPRRQRRPHQQRVHVRGGGVRGGIGAPAGRHTEERG